MTDLSQSPPTSQQLYETGQGTADTTGAIEIDFKIVPQSLAWTGSVAVPGSGPDVQWTAYVGSKLGGASNKWGSFYGSSTLQPVQVPANAQLILKATGLQPGQTYDAIFAGSSDPQDLAPIVSPETVANVSTLAESVPVINGVAGGLVKINAQPGWGSLRFFSNGSYLMVVTGDITGTTYAQDVEVDDDGFVSVLIDPTADPTYTLVFAGTITGDYWVTAQLGDVAVEVQNNPNEPLFVTGPFQSDKSVTLQTTTAGSQTLLAAAPSTQDIVITDIILNLGIVNGGTEITAEVIGTVGGFACILAAITHPSSTDRGQWNFGRILDHGTGLNLYLSGTPAEDVQVTVLYSLVNA